jgi:hypothetical protein
MFHGLTHFLLNTSCAPLRNHHDNLNQRLKKYRLPRETTKTREKLFLDYFHRRSGKKITTKKNEPNPLVIGSKSKPCSINRDSISAQDPRRTGERPGWRPWLAATTNRELTRSGGTTPEGKNKSQA